MRRVLFRSSLALGALLWLGPAPAHAQEGADIEGRFQEPADERRIEVEGEDGEGGGPSSPGRRPGGTGDSLEERLYLRERPDAIGEAARDYQDENLERLLEERERLLEQRRRTAIELLETFIREEPESAPEMPDALLRLAELRWEQARADYLEEFAAWQQVPAENRGPPPRPDYSVSLDLYDRILTQHRDFGRYDLVLYMKAFAMTELGRPQDALALYRRILDEFPESRFVPDSHMALAEARFAEADFAGALERYDQVLRYRESELYGMALFKSAWCLWRMNRTTEAATRFRRVLDLGRGRGQISAEQRARLRELQSEALEYLIQVFTEDESNTARDLFAFLEEIGGERYADRVLVRLASRFYEQDRWEHGIEAYELILERLPGDERAPRWALAVARGRNSLGEPDQAIDALERLAESYLEGSEWAEQQSDPELLAETREMVERAVRLRAMRWHDLAQREEQTALFERAERLYDIYLEHFPESEQSYDLRFYRAEILFHRLERWDDAGRSYLAAAQQNPEGRYTRDALYNAIGAFERVREAQLERCSEQRAGGAPSSDAEAEDAEGAPDEEASDEAEEPSAEAEGAEDEGEEGEAEVAEAEASDADPCAETDNDRRFSEAIELYVELFPEDPDLPEILFRQGRLYYDREIYDPAVRLFGQLLERYPNSPYAVTAGELILESFNRAQDYQNIERWARRLKDSPAFQTEESQRRLDTLILQAVFAIGEQLAERGEHDEAAQAYLRAAREFPEDERAPQAYFNAGLEYQAAGNLSGAASAYDQLIEQHPGSEIGARGAWAGAQMYESIAQFSDAARFYEAYGEHFPEGEQAADALYNATLLRVTAGDHDRAVQNGQRFLERFQRDDSATEVTFLIGRAHAAAGSWDQAAQVYRRFIRRTRDVNRQIEANARMAEVLKEAGQTRRANRALDQAVTLARRRRNQLNETGLYYAARARYMQAEDELRQYEEIQIAGPMDGLRQRLEQKSEFLRRAAEAFAAVVEYQVAEYVTAALFQIGRSYELYAEGLRNAPVPEGLNEEEEMAYFDQLSSFVIPIEERALEAYEGGYQTALELRIFNRWTASLREGLTRLNDVQYPPLREMGGEIADGAPIPVPQHLSGLRRGEPDDEEEAEEEDEGDGSPGLDTSITGDDDEEEDEDAEADEGEDDRRSRRRRRRRRRR
ncbi:MAG TPA: tetratricopeptide repeat protein [Sandaracinaceae bacterium LLY-WYZ-13_1]|nr:tetratricopeptide repeat protein [Sandaracinaceae bacterium LLY-WYZ-13_1]